MANFRYTNAGTADSLIVTGYTLRELPKIKSLTGTAFYQTQRVKCFDIPATPEIWAKFDVYFNGSARWRAYNGGTNKDTGIAAQTNGTLSIFIHGGENQRDTENVCKTNQLQKVLLHMVSGSTNGLVEVWVDGVKISNFTGDVNHGENFADFYLQSDGSGTFFSNVIISDAEILPFEGRNYTEFDVDTRVYNGLKGWRYYNPGYGERLKTGGTTIQIDRSVTGVAFHGGQQSDMFWTPDGIKEIWMRFDMITPTSETIRVSSDSRCYINAGHKSQTQNKIFGFTANTREQSYYLRVNKLVLPDDTVIWLTPNTINRCLIHMVSGAADGLFEITINGSYYRYTGNVNGGDDFNNIFLYSYLSPEETDDKRVLFSNVVISQTPITIEDGWHVDSCDVESKITAPVLNLRARGATHKFKFHTKKSKPANAISVAGRKFYGKFVATTDDNAGVIRARYDDANYALSKT